MKSDSCPLIKVSSFFFQWEAFPSQRHSSYQEVNRNNHIYRIAGSNYIFLDKIIVRKKRDEIDFQIFKFRAKSSKTVYTFFQHGTRQQDMECSPNDVDYYLS